MQNSKFIIRAKRRERSDERRGECELGELGGGGGVVRAGGDLDERADLYAGGEGDTVVFSVERGAGLGDGYGDAEDTGGGRGQRSDGYDPGGAGVAAHGRGEHARAAGVPG